MLASMIQCKSRYLPNVSERLRTNCGWSGYTALDDPLLVGHGVYMARRRSDRPDLYGYLDHRVYLRDEYAARKAEKRGFSFRAFSRRAGLQSPNHLKRVIDGERG